MSRAAVVHLNFRAGSTFPVPVCTESPGHWLNNAINRMSRCNKVDAVRLQVKFNFTEGSEAVPSINYIGRQLDVSYIGRQMYGEISIYQIRIQHETSSGHISSPKVREIHDHFLWRKRAQRCVTVYRVHSRSRRDNFSLKIPSPL